MSPKWRFSEKKGLNVKCWFCNPKRHCFDVFSIKISAIVLALGDCRYQKKTEMRVCSSLTLTVVLTTIRTYRASV